MMYNMGMNKKMPYLTQYCILYSEWQRNNIDVDNATESQIAQIQDLQAKAAKQSGLSVNEIMLISLCRARNIFKKVNTYARLCKKLR